MDIDALLGYIAASLTTFSFLPQLIRVALTRKTEDISRNMYILLNIGVFLWFVYGFRKNDYPIMLANLITLIFCITILYFKLNEKKDIE